MTIIIPKNTTLIRLVLQHRGQFYNQDWYYTQEFAHTDVGGEWHIDTDFTGAKYPAAVLAYIFINGRASNPLVYGYCWTSDVDNDGDQVYVGRARTGGFQIHRHLTIRPEQFINLLD